MESSLILQNDFKRQWADIGDEATAAFIVTGESGWYILGREVREFEAALASYWGVAHAIGVANGSDAIEIGLRVLGCRAGDRVLTTPVSAFATTLAIARIGAVPVFTDVDEYGLLDLEAARAELERNPVIRFMVPVHLYGHALHRDRLVGLRDELEIEILEDCAQSIGAHWNGAPTGRTGRIAATSFYPTKNLGALGDGGAILTCDDEFAERARMFRDYGQSSKYRHQLIGYNSRLDEVQAALLRRVTLPRLDRWTDNRRKIAQAYVEGIRHPHVRVPGAPAGSESCWHLFPVFVASDRKDEFMAHMKSRGVLTGEHYPVAIPDQTAMETIKFEIAPGGIARARELCRCEVSLPVHPYLTAEEVDTVIGAVNDWPG